MKNVLAYIRVSGKTQIDGDGFPRQIEAIKLFCAGRDLGLLTTHQERGVSGIVDGLDRPAFVSMLTEIECRRANGQEIAGFVVERADRIARDLMVSELLLSECRKRNIEVYAADRGECIDLANDDGNPTATLIRQILGAVAQFEKSCIVNKLRAAKKRLRAQGRKCDGRKPFGFRPEEKPIVGLFQNGSMSGFSLQRKADFLNGAGLTQRYGRPWNRKRVWQVEKQLAKGKQ